MGLQGAGVLRGASRSTGCSWWFLQNGGSIFRGGMRVLDAKVGDPVGIPLDRAPTSSFDADSLALTTSCNEHTHTFSDPVRPPTPLLPYPSATRTAWQSRSFRRHHPQLVDPCFSLHHVHPP